MMNSLDGKTAMITGSNRGIGRAIMELFMQEKCNIVACTRNSSNELISYYDECRKKYEVNIYPLYFDLSDEQAIQVVMKEFVAMKIDVDILINNAGYAKFGPFIFTKLHDIKYMMQINLFAPMIITQYVLKQMVKKQKGAIINLASISGMDTNLGNSAYGACKAAIISWTRTLSAELSKAHIRANAIAPGIIETEMQSCIDDEIKTEILSNINLGRWGYVEEVANLALFLASEASSYINGQVIRIDGGMK
jgi:3-oxoacyl-[acyl-carrier protein] reductase